MFDPCKYISDKAFKIDLLLNFKTTRKWIPIFHRHKDYWKIISGNWKFNSGNKRIYLTEPQKIPAENITIIGASYWDELVLFVNFKILSDSIRPPEGGIILYFMFKNIKNFYSFHFCLCKQKIEFIKRIKGFWTTTAQQDFDLKPLIDYKVKITTNSGIHQCLINGTDYIEVKDRDIQRGCIGIGAKYCSAEFNKVSVSLQ